MISAVADWSFNLCHSKARAAQCAVVAVVPPATAKHMEQEEHWEQLGLAASRLRIPIRRIPPRRFEFGFTYKTVHVFRRLTVHRELVARVTRAYNALLVPRPVRVA